MQFFTFISHGNNWLWDIYFYETLTSYEFSAFSRLSNMEIQRHLLNVSPSNVDFILFLSQMREFSLLFVFPGFGNVSTRHEKTLRNLPAAELALPFRHPISRPLIISFLFVSNFSFSHLSSELSNFIRCIAFAKLS